MNGPVAATSCPGTVGNVGFCVSGISLGIEDYAKALFGFIYV